MGRAREKMKETESERERAREKRIVSLSRFPRPLVSEPKRTNTPQKKETLVRNPLHLLPAACSQKNDILKPTRKYKAEVPLAISRENRRAARNCAEFIVRISALCRSALQYFIVFSSFRGRGSKAEYIIDNFSCCFLYDRMRALMNAEA